MIVKFKHSLFEDKASKYCVYIYENTDDNVRVTCVGTALPTSKISYEFITEQVNHPKFGIQYKVLSYKEHIGTGRNNIVAYLSSGLIKGIGQKLAERIYDKFGDKSLEVLDKNPDEYLKIKGISKHKLDKIVTSYGENHIPNDIIDFFTPFHMPIEKVFEFYKVYKYNLLPEVNKNPFILCKFKGITFKDVDPIHKNLGLKYNSHNRVLAAATEILNNYMFNGMVGVTKEMLISQLYQYTDIDAHELWKIIIALINKEKITYRKLCLTDKTVQYFYLPYIKEIEEDLADKIVYYSNTGVDESKEAIKLMDKHHSSLDVTQRQAVINCFSCSLSVITGGPGTGKTTTIKEIVDIQQKLHPNESIYLMAPTGLAARRMSEATGLPATTIHKGLELGIHSSDEIYEYDEDNVVIKDSLLIIDEFSMVDMLIAHKIFDSICNTRVILVGDIDQLPSISCGNVLKDIINSEVVKTTRLKYVHRQSGDSTICENAHLICEGVSSLVESDDFHIHYSDATLAEIQEQMVEAYISAYNNPEYKSIMCLSPYKKYDAGVYALNIAIQDKINPLNNRVEVKGHNGMTFRAGDKVMHILSNTEDVVNGDIGRVSRIYKEDGDDIVEVEYETADGKIYKDYDKSSLKNLTLAYAMTVHKSQGSECDKVIMCITSFHKAMLKRKILYTGITRAKKDVELFTTSKELIGDIVSNINEIDRNTLLGYLIKVKTDTLYKQEVLAI